MQNNPVTGAAKPLHGLDQQIPRNCLGDVFCPLPAIHLLSAPLSGLHIGKDNLRMAELSRRDCWRGITKLAPRGQAHKQDLVTHLKRNTETLKNRPGIAHGRYRRITEPPPIRENLRIGPPPILHPTLRVDRRRVFRAGYASLADQTKKTARPQWKAKAQLEDLAQRPHMLAADFGAENLPGGDGIEVGPKS